MIGILAVFAQLERDMIVERTTTGRRQKVIKAFGMEAGFRLDIAEIDGRKRLKLSQKRPLLLKKSTNSICKENPALQSLNGQPSQTKARVFDHFVIRDMLARPIYMGKLVNAGTLVNGKHEPIIDEETWFWQRERDFHRRKEGLTPMGDYFLTIPKVWGVRRKHCTRQTSHPKI